MRPSEPFVIEFLSGEWRNVTAEQVNRELYPIGTYSYLGQLVIVFLVTDILRYKPIIVLSAVVGIIIWALLLWTYSIPELMIGQFFYGTFMAAEVAYYTYIYAKVDREKYQIVTGHTRSAILVGKFLGGVLGQILVSFDLMDLRELNYVSLASQIASLLFALMLPSVTASLYFYTIPTKIESPPSSNCPSTLELNYTKSAGINDNESGSSNSEHTLRTGQSHPHKITTMTALPPSTPTTMKNDDFADLKPEFSWQRAYQLLWQHFLEAYTNPVVVQWSLWWALAMAGYLQVVSYAQLLWKEIDTNRENFYNGGVEAAMTLLSALGAFLAGFFDSSQYRKWDLWILTVCSVVESLLIIISAFTTSVWVAYVMYVLFGILYNFMVTVASAIVAKKIHEDSFGLIFGINTVVALATQTILILIIISDSGFALSPRGQFYAFGGYFLGVSVLYAISGVVQLCRKQSDKIVLN